MTTSRAGLRVHLAHAAYAVLVHLACLLALLPQLVRGLRDKDRRRWLRKRLGRLPDALPAGRPVWIHAVSVGEVKASRPLVAALREQYPELPLVLSTGTRTGFSTARRLFPDLCVIAAPLDLPWVVKRVVRRVEPRLVVLVELEVWPSFMRCLDEAGIPQVIVNGRISASSFRRYKWLRWWLPEFDRLDLVAAQDETYRSRLEQLGVPAERIHVTGNLKHDLIGSALADEVETLGRSLGLSGGLPVIVAGSTHDGEDGPAVRAWQAAGGAEVAQLVLVPRHLRRLKDISRLLHKLEVPFQLRSEAGPERTADTVLLVDTMGELESFFGLADVVFLGGSLTPVGGHNVLEPAAAGCPVVVGPHLETCQREARILTKAGGLEVVQDKAGLGRVIARLIADPAEREQMGDAARQAVIGLQGATAANLQLLQAQGFLDGSALDRVGECSTLGRPSPEAIAGPRGETASSSHTGPPSGPSNGPTTGPSSSPRTGASVP